MIQADSHQPCSARFACNAGRTPGTTTRRMNPLLAIATALLIPSCALLEEPAETQGAPEAEEIERLPAAPRWGTGTNSATVGDGLLFDELNSDGMPNEYGLRIDSARLRDGTPLRRISVRRHHLVAVDDRGTTYSGYALVNAVIVLKHPVHGAYEVFIEAYYPQDLQFWVNSREAPTEIVPFYLMKARREGDVQRKPEYVCREDRLEPVWGRTTHAALVFQGDYYDPIRKTVSSVPESLPLDSDPRFNVACAGTAPAKMHLTRHTRAGSINDVGRPVYPTSVSHRQAMLKMFTADYCGTGRSFTVDGFPLTYSDGRTEFARWSEATGLEAVWKARGAICLNTPRRGPEVAAEIAAHCGTIPRCDSFPWIPSYGALRYPYVTSKLLPL